LGKVYKSPSFKQHKQATKNRPNFFNVSLNSEMIPVKSFLLTKPTRVGVLLVDAVVGESEAKHPFLSAYFAEDFLKRCTMIGAVNILGFAISACEIVERNESLENRGTVDTDRFEEYIAECVVPIVGNYAAGEPNSVVVMDNAIIQMSERIEEMINDAGGILLFIAPNSPHINPILEYCTSSRHTRQHLQ